MFTAPAALPGIRTGHGGGAGPAAEPSFRVAALPLGRADRHLCGIYLPLVGGDLLGVSFWDYTGVFGNFRGRVCLPFSLAWGLLLFPAVYLVTPPVVVLADRVPIGVTWWLLLAFTADAVCSLRFLAVTHDLEALRAVIWPVSADR